MEAKLEEMIARETQLKIPSKILPLHWRKPIAEIKLLELLNVLRRVKERYRKAQKCYAALWGSFPLRNSYRPCRV